jgi:hypothetical protein
MEVNSFGPGWMTFEMNSGEHRLAVGFAEMGNFSDLYSVGDKVLEEEPVVPAAETLSFKRALKSLQVAGAQISPFHG